MTQRIKFRGMFIPMDQIDQYEQLYGGKFVYDERLAAMLETVAAKYVRERGKVPGALKLSSHPFTYFMPIRIEAEIIGMNLSGIQTNQFVFIAVKRIM